MPSTSRPKRSRHTDAELEAKLIAEVRRRADQMIAANDYHLLQASDVYTCGAEAAEVLFTTDQGDGKLHFRHDDASDFVMPFLQAFKTEIDKELRQRLLAVIVREWAERSRLMPSKTKKQQIAMRIAAQGKSNIGIPQSVGKEFVRADKGKKSFKGKGKRKS